MIGIESFAQEGFVITPEVINTSFILNLIGNHLAIELALASYRALILEFLTASHRETIRYAEYAPGIGVTLIVCIHAGSMILHSAWVRNDKMEVYRCLISLPTSAVSDVVKALRINRRETETEDSAHGQDENILKLFNTAAGAERSVGDVGEMTIKAILSALASLVALIVVVLYVQDATTILRSAAPMCITRAMRTRGMQLPSS